MVGDGKRMGDWDPACSNLQFFTEASTYPIWKLEADFEPDSLLQFKLVISQDSAHRWEDKVGNRKVQIYDEDMEFHMNWGEDTISMEALPEDETTDAGDQYLSDNDTLDAADDKRLKSQAHLDGQWHSSQTSGLVTIKNLQATWPHGQKTDLEHIPDTYDASYDYKMYFGGYEHYAIYQPGKLVWSDGDAWQLKDSKPACWSGCLSFLWKPSRK